MEIVCYLKRVASRCGKERHEADTSKKRIADGKIATEPATFSGGVSYRDAGKRRGMSISQLYLWRKRFLEEGGIALKTSIKQANKQGRQPQAEDDGFQNNPHPRIGPG